MKNLLLFFTFLTFFVSAQTPQELQKQIDNLQEKQSSYQSQLLTLQNEIQSVKTENIYFKQALDIQTPILEQTQNDIHVKVTKVEGNRAEKTITISYLIDTNGYNKKIEFERSEIIDTEGTLFKNDYGKSDYAQTELAIQVPFKKHYGYSEIQGEPLFLNLFRFETGTNKEGKLFKDVRSKFEFRDLKVDWK